MISLFQKIRRRSMQKALLLSKCLGRSWDQQQWQNGSSNFYDYHHFYQCRRFHWRFWNILQKDFHLFSGSHILISQTPWFFQFSFSISNVWTVFLPSKWLPCGSLTHFVKSACSAVITGPAFCTLRALRVWDRQCHSKDLEPPSEHFTKSILLTSEL